MRDINSLNKVILIGRLGQNPETRYIPQTDRAVTNFSLATNERTFNPNTNESDIRTELKAVKLNCFHLNLNGILLIKS